MRGLGTFSRKRLTSLIFHGLVVAVPFTAGTVSAALFWYDLFQNAVIAGLLVGCIDVLALSGLVLYLARIESPFVHVRVALPFVSILPLGRELYLLLATYNAWQVAAGVAVFVTVLAVVLDLACFRTIERLFITPLEAVQERMRDEVTRMQQDYERAATVLRAYNGMFRDWGNLLVGMVETVDEPPPPQPAPAPAPMPTPAPAPAPALPAAPSAPALTPQWDADRLLAAILEASGRTREQLAGLVSRYGIKTVGDVQRALRMMGTPADELAPGCPDEVWWEALDLLMDRTVEPATTSDGDTQGEKWQTTARAILECLETIPDLRTGKVAARINRSVRTVQIVRNKLVQAGIIEKRGGEYVRTGVDLEPAIEG